MKRSVILLLAAAAAAPLTAQVRRINIFELVLEDRRIELEWFGTTSFRVLPLESFDRARVPLVSDPVRVECANETDAFRCRTEHIELTLEKRGGRMSVVRRNGRPVWSAVLSETFTAAVRPGERFYGLGPRKSPKLDLAGSRVESEGGLMISSAGYGEYRAGRCAYDFGATERKVSCGGEFHFYFGPTPKEIIESHTVVRNGEGKSAWVVRADGAKRSWNDLREYLYEAQHASMSGLDARPFPSGGYEGAARLRAEQIAALMPLVHAPLPRMPRFRARLEPYILTYAWEARDRGIPIIRPVAMQFPEDVAGAAKTDQFMLGDEMLVAPVFDKSGSVKVYLPRGIWTDLRTGEVYKGRQEITVKAPAEWTPILIRNGMLVPLAGPGPLQMHYYPKLGAEFFLWEPADEYISQFHAAPTTDLLRLESESLIDRDFDWVVHHMEEPVRVSEGEREFARADAPEQLKPGMWHFDQTKRILTVRVRAKARGNEIVHASFAADKNPF